MTRLFVTSLLFAFVAVIGTPGGQTQPEPNGGSNPPPTILTVRESGPKAKPSAPKQEEPLLLLDEDKPTGKRTANMADNSRCEVCHLNLMKEELALSHAKSGIGCANCHGASDAHIADESWASGGNGTAPEIMFPKAKINPGCLACHAKEKLDPDFHKEFLAGKSDEKFCTDCHGKHRVPNRKCKWK